MVIKKNILFNYTLHGFNLFAKIMFLLNIHKLFHIGKFKFQNPETEIIQKTIGIIKEVIKLFCDSILRPIPESGS